MTEKVILWPWIYRNMFWMTESFKVREELTEEQSTHDSPDDDTLQIVIKEASPLKMEIHDAPVSIVFDTVVVGGDSAL
ncbi:hypothetical protein SUGI_1019460 [Cryptomeria japonica]|nr:hypothetical protein SUGI_1019460 [Cryptomeria japonica]